MAKKRTSKIKHHVDVLYTDPASGESGLTYHQMFVRGYRKSSRGWTTSSPTQWKAAIMAERANLAPKQTIVQSSAGVYHVKNSSGSEFDVYISPEGISAPNAPIPWAYPAGTYDYDRIVEQITGTNPRTAG